MLLGEHAMDLASVFDWFAQDSIRAAEQTGEPRKREILLKLASQWAAAAQRCRDEQPTQQVPAVTPRNWQTAIFSIAFCSDRRAVHEPMSLKPIPLKLSRGMGD
jgi:hypothetical protein